MMNIPQKDGSILTTPLYVGTQEQVNKAVTCKHEFEAHGKLEVVKKGEKARAQMEKCEHCCATRMRFFGLEVEKG